MFFVQYAQGNGVPQGSSLAVMLFAVAINGMVNVVGSSVATLLYVDDITICYSFWSIVTIKHQLQGTIYCLLPLVFF
jgi:hypothetical protein